VSLFDRKTSRGAFSEIGASSHWRRDQSVRSISLQVSAKARFDFEQAEGLQDL
jgi:hypothetical protein